jgi:hypothetical protein
MPVSTVMTQKNYLYLNNTEGRGGKVVCQKHHLLAIKWKNNQDVHISSTAPSNEMVVAMASKGHYRQKNWGEKIHNSCSTR